MAARKTSVSSKKSPQKSTAKARSTHKSSQVKTATAKSSGAKTQPVAEHHASVSRPATTASKTAHRRTSASSKRTASTASHRVYAQQQPTPDRYREIQQALADRGYFKGTVDGTWGADSVDALKRFEHDQNITDDGKIGSLALIALGLGPKRAANAESPEKPVQ